MDAKHSNFDIFESALYMKSGRMPLRHIFATFIDHYWYASSQHGCPQFKF